MNDGSTVKIDRGAAYDAGYGQEVATGAARDMAALYEKLAEKVQDR